MRRLPSKVELYDLRRPRERREACRGPERTAGMYAMRKSQHAGPSSLTMSHACVRTAAH